MTVLIVLFVIALVIGFLLLVVFLVLVLPAVVIFVRYLSRWLAPAMRLTKALTHTTASSVLASTSIPSAAAT